MPLCKHSKESCYRCFVGRNISIFYRVLKVMQVWFSWAEYAEFARYINLNTINQIKWFKSVFEHELASYMPLFRLCSVKRKLLNLIQLAIFQPISQLIPWNSQGMLTVTDVPFVPQLLKVAAVSHSSQSCLLWIFTLKGMRFDIHKNRFKWKNVLHIQLIT